MIYKTIDIVVPHQIAISNNGFCGQEHCLYFGFDTRNNPYCRLFNKILKWIDSKGLNVKRCSQCRKS